MRISFIGGGTDFKSFYEKTPGSVISATINKYIYVMVNKRFDDQIRIGYSKTEIVDDIDSIQHGIVRECLRKVGIKNGIEIVTVADIPSTGSGLGSSSTLTVGLLNALYRYKRKEPTREQLAKEACDIEIEILGEPIGKQDQYAAAYGGLNRIIFNQDESVDVAPITLSDDYRYYLTSHIGMYYTNISRNSRDILKEEKDNMWKNISVLNSLTDKTEYLYEILKNEKYVDLGWYIDYGWNIKKTLSNGVSNPYIDSVISNLKNIGVTGAKLVGAGGGGFVLLWIGDRLNWSKVSKHMDIIGFKPLPSRFEFEGTKCLISE